MPDKARVQANGNKLLLAAFSVLKVVIITQ